MIHTNKGRDKREMGETAVDSPLLQGTAVHFVIAHLVYGGVLGYWLGKK